MFVATACNLLYVPYLTGCAFCRLFCFFKPLQAWVTGVFFCYGVMAWLIRALLLAMVTPLSWLNPRNSASHGAKNNGEGGRRRSSLVSSSSSSGGGRQAAARQQQQQLLPGCARAVPLSPNRRPAGQNPGDYGSNVTSVTRVYGTPVTYADAVTHGVQDTYVSDDDAVGVSEGNGGDVAGVLKSPRRGGQGGSGSSSGGGRVRFADQA